MERIISYPFASTKHFLDLVVDDPKFKSLAMQNIISEKYQISKRLHTSFVELDEITPFERKALLKLIIDDLEEQRRIIEQSRVQTT